MGFIKDIDPQLPQDTDEIRLGDDEIRQLKLSWTALRSLAVTQRPCSRPMVEAAAL